MRRPAPDWHLESVVYEIFPDRFARGGVDADAPAWAVRARVGRAGPTGPGVDGLRECSAATCAGSRSGSATSRRSARTSLYLTPIFPAGSTHRYDAHALDRVDPLLGGDEALDELLRAAHARGHARRRAT